MIGILPQWFQIFFWSMVPWVEARYVIPLLAMKLFGWEWWQAFPLAVAGNMLPVPFILLFFKFAEKFLRNYKFWTRIMDWFFSRTRRRADSKIRKYEYLGLILFVAIPLPFTGAWTGSLIAYLFDLKFSRSLVTIFFGVIISVAITILLYSAGLLLWTSFNG
ncbi:MAG: small multi-drug export protein [Thermoplasmatales archaeon]|nr:small multi-drug export protein [Thermoplasmatales archaeon]MCK5260928.1 small multi-drug export protein [Thermoplasmatales archaeon]